MSSLVKFDNSYKTVGDQFYHRTLQQKPRNQDSATETQPRDHRSRTLPTNQLDSRHSPLFISIIYCYYYRAPKAFNGAAAYNTRSRHQGWALSAFARITGANLTYVTSLTITRGLHYARPFQIVQSRQQIDVRVVFVEANLLPPSARFE